ncbi:hypothetical protein KIPB_000138 [Kipferlia bialata]|uniref:VOC domain-containing protein n=1 Tax=Kipferlia bialata TaxID=797122 RepID=A0A9K3CNK9_9EUKA|nr:hypothetical protein KIPB_000138 [Kipferlia bialata]|eukprot:g138.t1
MSHHMVCYIEFPARDLEATRTFFTEVFGWEFTKEETTPDYITFHNPGTTGGRGKRCGGGFYQSDKVSTVATGAGVCVIHSECLEETLDAVKKAGGKVVRPIFTYPGGRRFHFSDPSGNEWAVCAQ